VSDPSASIFVGPADTGCRSGGVRPLGLARNGAGGEEREWYLAGSGLVDHEGGLRELRLAEAVRRVRGALAAQEEEVALARRVCALPRVRA